jgi:tetratricopeptide (TPR) repeat protein
MEVARAAGYLLLHVTGLTILSQVALEADDPRAALEYAREADALYGRRAPESAMMLRIFRCIADAHSAMAQHPQAFEVLKRAHALARETGNLYSQQVIEAQLGRHYLRTGDSSKAAEVLEAAAAELGDLGAKYDIAMVRFWYAEVLWKRCMAGISDDRAKDIKRARSNVFEARRLLESMQAANRLKEVAALEEEFRNDAPSTPPSDLI